MAPTAVSHRARLVPGLEMDSIMVLIQVTSITSPLPGVTVSATALLWPVVPITAMALVMALVTTTVYHHLPLLPSRRSRHALLALLAMHLRFLPRLRPVSSGVLIALSREYVEKN